MHEALCVRLGAVSCEGMEGSSMHVETEVAPAHACRLQSTYATVLCHVVHRDQLIPYLHDCAKALTHLGHGVVPDCACMLCLVCVEET